MAIDDLQLQFDAAVSEMKSLRAIIEAPHNVDSEVARIHRNIEELRDEIAKNEERIEMHLNRIDGLQATKRNAAELYVVASERRDALFLKMQERDRRKAVQPKEKLIADLEAKIAAMRAEMEALQKG